MKWHKENPRKRDRSEVARAGLASLRTLEVLCRAYDDGSVAVSRDITVAIHRLVQDEALKAGCRRELRLPSYTTFPNPKSLSPHRGHLVASLPPNSGEITFSGAFNFPSGERPWAILPFNLWWNEPILIEGAGGAIQAIPINPRDHIPFEKRRKLCRREAIDIFRNQAGAHFDHGETEGLRFLSLWDKTTMFIYTDEAGSEWNSSDHPEKFKFNCSVADVIARSIAQELLDGNTRFLLESVSQPLN